MLDLPIYASSLLGLVAATGFAADGVRPSRGGVLIAPGFAAGLALAYWVGVPGPGSLGLIVAAIAAARLFWPLPRGVLPVVAGVLAGFCAALYHTQSLPWAAAAVLVLAGPLLAMVLAKQPGFAPAPLQEEAMVMLLLLGLVLAAMPQIASGWRSAAILTPSGASHAAPRAIAWWVVVYVGITAMLGGVRSLWGRR